MTAPVHVLRPAHTRESLQPVRLLDLWGKWLIATEDASDGTVRTRTRSISSLCSHASKTPLELTTLDIVAWLADQRSSWTRHTYAVSARQWHRWLAQQGYRGDDPSGPLPLPPCPKSAPRPVATDVLHEVLDQAPLRACAYIKLAAYEGLRVHEVAKIRGDDFEDDRDDGGNEWLYVVGKGDKQRVLPVHPAVARLRHGYPERGWWFPARSGGGHIGPGAVSHTIGRAFRAAGYDVTAHQLRHWFGTHIQRTGRDLRVTQELMGHASASSTQIYTEVADRAKQEAVRRLAGGVT